MKPIRELFTKEIRISLFVIAGLAVLAVILTIIIVLASRGHDPKETLFAASPNFQEAQKLSLEDLAIPDEFLSIEEMQLELFRKQLKKWSWEQVRPYWIDPREAALEVLGQRNEELIDALMKDVR